MRRRLISLLVLICFGVASFGWAAPKKKKKKKEDEEPITQTLEIPKDPPPAIVADASRLTFFVSPLSNKGLLTAQIRNAVKSLMSQSKGTQIVKIRAFVAGSGDLRRVPSVVSELFTDKKLQLPAVSAVQVGALPLVGAQVQLQAIAVARKVLNPHGLAFVSGQAGTARQAGASLVKALADNQLQSESVKQITCFVDSLEFEGTVRQQMGTAFPRAVTTFAQLRRDSAGDFSECEAVASLAAPPAASPTMLGANDRFSQVALVGPVPVAFTGIQMAFGREPQDIALALDRFAKTLESVNASWKTVAFGPGYLLTSSIRDAYRAERLKLIDPKAPPASTTLVFEGLQSPDASFGVEAVAVVRK
jgi:enamine deaminase RidA (YjgF/YER057c/UK114 family)